MSQDLIGKSNVRIVTGLEILLMRYAMNVAAVGITNGIRNVEYAIQYSCYGLVPLLFGLLLPNLTIEEVFLFH